MCSVYITKTTKIYQEQGIVAAHDDWIEYRAYRLNIYQKQNVVVTKNNRNFTIDNKEKICTKSKPNVCQGQLICIVWYKT